MPEIGNVNWNGDEFLASATTEVERVIARSVVKMQDHARQIVSRTSGPTATNPGASPSRPGEPPHIRTGTLRASIDQETFRRAGEFVGRMGTNLDYGRFLETGTRKMAARPYLRPTLDAHRLRILADLKAAGEDFGA